MLKIFNSRNPSLFGILVLLDFPGARRLFKLFYRREHRDFIASRRIITAYVGKKWDSSSFLHIMSIYGKGFLLSFQPLADLLKGFVDTFRPYKSTHHFLSDLAQPLRGMGNILKGLLTLIGAPLFAIGFTGYCVVMLARTHHLGYLKNVALIFLNLVPLVIENALAILRGVIQVVTTPLMLIKIALRGMITGCMGKPKIQNNRGIKRLLDDAKKTEEDEELDAIKKEVINFRLGQKYKKAKRQGRSVPIIGMEFKKTIEVEERVHYEGDEEPTIETRYIPHTDYISFFKSITPRNENADVIEIHLESPSTNNAPKASTGLRHFLFKPQYPKTRATAGFIVAAAGSGLAYTALTPKLAMMLLGTALTPHVAIALLAVGLFLAAVGTAMFIHGLIANCQQNKKPYAQADRDIEAQNALDSLGIN